jgi:alanine racemase
LRVVKRFAKALNSFNKSAEHKDFPIHIDIETGMNRLGFSEDEIPELKKLLAENPHLKIQSIFSHLAASEVIRFNILPPLRIDELTNPNVK